MVLFLYLIYLNFIFAKNNEHCLSTLSKNDDFCDCYDGSDEIDTSACSGVVNKEYSSHLLSNSKFNKKYYYKCQGSGILNITIPQSRIGDGICDCCDGSDEINTLFSIKCPNVCNDLYENFRIHVKNNYSSMKRGVDAKSTLMRLAEDSKNKIKFKKSELYREWKYLYSAQSDIDRIYNGYLNDEREEHFMMLRDRMYDCATSTNKKSNCNFFEVNEEILKIREDKADNNMSSSSFPYAINHYEIYNRTNPELLQKMSRQNRLRISRCYYPHLRPIAPSKYKNFGQFLQFAKGKYGINRRKKLKQSNSIRQRGLLGRFLEFEDGTFQFWMTSCEIVSFTLLPITLPLKGIAYLIDYLIEQAELAVVVNSYDNEKDGNNISFIQSYFIDGFKYVWNGFLDISEGNFMKFELSGNAIYVRYLRPLKPILNVPHFLWKMIWIAPEVYYKYYADSESYYSFLQSAEACILREGNRVIDLEVEDIKNELQLIKRNYDNDVYQSRGINWGHKDSWKQLHNECIEKMISGYTYRLCLFEDIRQDGLLLGRYEGWGNSSSTVQGFQQNKSPENDSLYQNKLYVIETSAYFTSLVTSFIGMNLRIKGMPGYNDIEAWLKSKFLYPSDTPEINDDNDAYYKQQFYGKGNYCQDRHREVIVHYSCSSITEIIDVEEVEKCVYHLYAGIPMICQDIDVAKAKDYFAWVNNVLNKEQKEVEQE